MEKEDGLMAMPDILTSEVQNSLIIKASKSKVFEALISWQNYPNWNPYIRKIKGSPQVGQAIMVSFHMGFGPQLTLKCQVAEVDPQKSTLAWEYKAKLPGTYNALHSFSIEELGPGQCQIIQKEKIQGLFGCRLFWFFHQLLKKRFHAMHEALREQLEKSAAA